MEQNGIKNNLKEAYENKEFIKVLFVYPNALKKTIKSGHVKKIYDNSFDFDESFDGHTTYSYDYIVQVIRPQIEVDRPSEAEYPNSQNKGSEHGTRID